MSLSAFLTKNTIQVENVKYVASKRFLSDNPELDERGNPIVIGKTADGKPIHKMKPMEWEIKAITGTEDEALR